MSWEHLAVALALICVIEGLLLALMPGLVRRLGDKLRHTPDNELRVMGVVALAVGTFLFYILRS